MKIFDVKNLYYSYDKYNKNVKYELDNVSFDVEKGDFLAIIGKTGSGKSTLLSHLNGIIKADKGEIYYNGQNIYDKNFNLTSLRFNCGVVFQYPEYQLFSETVIEDVCFGAIKMGLGKEEAVKRAEHMLDKLGVLYLKDESPFTLSGGEKRKVAFAGVIVMQPEILILDEPEAGLDTISKKEFYNFLKSLNEDKQITIIFTTHNLDDVVEYANRVIIMNDGQIVANGKTHEVFLDNSIMEKNNLEKPYAIEIIKKLQERNIDVDSTKIKMEDIINTLLHIKGLA